MEVSFKNNENYYAVSLKSSRGHLRPNGLLKYLKTSCRRQLLQYYYYLLYLSVSTRGVIGQFCCPLNFKVVSFPRARLTSGDITNILVFSVRTVSYGPSLFLLIYSPRASRLSYKLRNVDP